MSLRRIGEASVARVEEMLRPGFQPVQLLPDWTPDILERHRHWMVPNYFDPVEERFISSIHSWLIRTRHHTILVDACGGNHKERPHFPRFHRLDTPYLDRLRAAGVQPEEVDFVLCTHLHIDHVGWNTRLQNGRWVPTFPKARYLMSRIEHDFWDPAAPGEHSAEDVAVYQDSVLPVVAAGQAQFLDGTHQVDDGLLIEPAPGHTPGHVTLLLESQGHKALFTGDIMHQPVQVFEPQLNSCFCEDAVQAERTRRRVLDYCVEHRALMMPAHFGAPHAGHIRRQGHAYAIDFSA